MLTRLLSGIFGGAVALRNSLYDSGRFEVKELRGPVVSIGNISVGGSGKTPFAIALGKLLKERGITFDVLSRGYRRESKGTKIVDQNGSPREFGDEPLLIARELGVNVVVGESRFEAGQLAENTWGPRLHLLDDGFQHRKLARHFDIVLISPEDMHDTLLPAGRLREPIASLVRADAIVLTQGGVVENGGIEVKSEVESGKSEGKGIPSFPSFGKGGVLNVVVTRDLHLDLRNELEGAPSFPSFGKGGVVENNGKAGVVRPVLFCGIAKPNNFFRQVRAMGFNPMAEIAFRDHHRYTVADVRQLHQVAEKNRADSFITTAKDAINLEEVWKKEVWGGHSCPPLFIAKLKVTIHDADILLDRLLSKAVPMTNN